ncbi:outer membrane protein assembly factor BamE domain-containing protein [Winogradskyella sp.]|uniref:outer membrane protein assembly factor BamE domain-containing protein n=1 Tax=Winogradskyella sp. TaxID=1883156 RepID=UPI003BA92697
MIQKLSRNNKIGLFFFLAFIISMSLIWTFEERFDKQRWKNQPDSRYQMIDDLIESQLLMGTTKAQVISLLGEPTSSSQTDKDSFIYNIGDPPSFFNSRKEHLLIIFVDQKVDEVTLAYE